MISSIFAHVWLETTSSSADHGAESTTRAVPEGCFLAFGVEGLREGLRGDARDGIMKLIPSTSYTGDRGVTTRALMFYVAPGFRVRLLGLVGG